MAKYPVRSIRMKKLVLEWAEAHGSVAVACREWDVPRSTFYRWKEAFAKEGEAGLVRKRPIAKSHPRGNKLIFSYNQLSMQQMQKKSSPGRT